MSRLLLPNGGDHPDAAAKLLSDAGVLLAGSRCDGAAYLAGYVVECALKSLVLVEQGVAVSAVKPFRHDLNRLSVRALQLAALPSSKTARYVPRQTAGHSLYDPKHGWSETLRYRPPGVPPTTAQAWVAEAQGVFESTVLPMRLDGVI
jgi:hypothetical protein